MGSITQGAVGGSPVLLMNRVIHLRILQFQGIKDPILENLGQLPARKLLDHETHQSITPIVVFERASKVSKLWQSVPVLRRVFFP